MPRKRPLVGVISDYRMIGPHPFHAVGEKYLDAVVLGAGAIPLSIPVLGDHFDALEILEHVDGLFMTGSPSNVEPGHYRGDPSEEGTWHDPARDAVSLAMIPAAVRAGTPLLAVCRGLQEMNVAFGGTLHQQIHRVDGLMNHRENPDASIEVQYAPAHAVSFEPGGLMQEITGLGGATVNSLHSQGVRELGDGLVVEATAPDGLIEAFVVRDAPGFTLAVQWHPEWRVTEDEVSMAIFQAFGEACARRSE